MHLKKNFFSATIIKITWHICKFRDLKNQKLIFDICLNPLIMCKAAECVGLGQEGVAWEWVELSEIP